MNKWWMNNERKFQQGQWKIGRGGSPQVSSPPMMKEELRLPLRWKNKTQGWIPWSSLPPEAACTFGSTTSAWLTCLSLQVSPNQLANYTVGRIRSCRAALTKRNKRRKGQGPRPCSARHAMSTFASHAGNCTTLKETVHHTLQQFWGKSSGWGS